MNGIRPWKHVLAGAWSLLALCAIATAQDVQIQYAGQLQNAAAMNLTGTVAMEFRLFATPVGGLPEDAYWGEIHVSVKVSGEGQFEVILGQGATLGIRDADQNIVALIDILDGRALFLEVSPVIGGQPRPIVPRQPVLYAPQAGYAVRAEHADLAHGLVQRPDDPDQIPPGTIIAFAGPESAALALENSGWLFCDGRKLNAAEDLEGNDSTIFQPLFEAIGRQWGAPDDAFENDFRIPDLRGVFLRGVLGDRGPEDNGKFYGEFADEDRAIPLRGEGQPSEVGSFQQDAFKKHDHANGFSPEFNKVLRLDHLDTTDGTDNSDPDNEVNIAVGDPMSDGTFANSDYRSDTSLSTETRPENIAVHYLIRY